jgi:Cu(I)/Ag(I) efflux system membrane fusion protein
MRRTGLFLALVAVPAAGAGGYWAGQHGFVLPGLEMLSQVSSEAASAGEAATGPIIYYRHPDGKAAYSAVPRATDDGRAFAAVHASEDLSFDPAAKATDAAAGGSSSRTILYYRNPMGLPDTSPVPKKDSMGMDYIPVHEGEAEDGSIVKVSAGKLQRSGVKTILATTSSVLRPVRVPGMIQLDERRVSIISTRTEAFVEEVADVTTGQLVEQGRPLVGLYAREIASAGAEYATNLKSGGAADGAVLRLKNLGVPAEAIAEIKKTGKVPLTVTLTAPRSGVVLQRMAVDGMMAAAGAELFRIADISTVWVMADVPEYQLSSIRVGALARIGIRSLPGRTFTGKVDLIYPEIQRETRTARIRIELPNPDSLLLANMYADVDIASGAGKPVVTVPDSAVIDTGDRKLVIVDKGDGKFEPRDVKTGMRGEGMVEITDGLVTNERVVVSANFLIDAESNLKAALSALTPAETKP